MKHIFLLKALKIVPKSILIVTVLSFFLNVQFAFATTLANGIDASYVLGKPDFTTSTGTTPTVNQIGGAPQGVAFDNEGGRLFVADTDNKRVLVYDLSGGITNGMNASYVLGQANFTSNTAATTQAGLQRPFGVGYDEINDYLFVADNGAHRVMVYDVSTITNGENAIYVLGQDDFTSSSQGTTQDTLNGIYDVAVDGTNERLFVSDFGNARVMVFDYTGGFTNGMNASYVLGQANFTSNNSEITQSGMSAPSRIYFDSAGDRLFVLETSNRVLVFNTTSISNGENAVNVIGQANFTSSGSGAGASSLNNPDGITFDSVNSRLFVSSTNNNRVVVFDISGGITNGMSATYILGQADFTGTSINYGGALVSDGRGGFSTGLSQKGFSTPGNLAYGVTEEYLFVLDRGNARVMVFDLTPILSGGKGYVKPPTCSANFSPNSITKGQEAVLSWGVEWSTDHPNWHYIKVPGKGVFGPNTTSTSLSPDYSTTIQLAAVNLYGATFCEAQITVLDTDGTEIVSTQDSYLTANSIKSPLGSMIVEFFKRLIGKK